MELQSDNYPSQFSTQVSIWIDSERQTHAATKYSAGLPGREALVKVLRESGYSQEWQDFIGNYLKRVELLDIRTPAGRQAMGKAIVSLLHCLETACELYGDMPEPGHPSGEIVEWR